MLTVYTAVFGPSTERVRTPAVVEPGVRYLCFTDGDPAPAPYETVQTPSTEAKPHLSARRVKILAEHPSLAHGALLWHDASYRLLRGPRWVERRLAGGCDLAAMRHARRTRIEEEALAIARYGYVTSDRAVALVAGYRAEGFAGEGLSSSGLMGFRSSPAVSAFRRRWWEEALAWGGRDQGSMDYAAWASGCRIGYVKGNHRANPYAAWRQPA